MMHRHLVLTCWAFLALFSTGFLGCGGSSSTCEAGRQIECACAGGDSGFQQCRDDGSGWEECDCGCQPDCVGKECGDDGCGGSCGTCSSLGTCTAQGICECGAECTVAAWANLDVGLVEEFDIDYQGVILDGVREVASIDTEYRQGIQAFKVEFRANNNLIATRWYQIAGSGLLLLGENVVEESQAVTRTFVTPIQVLPYPITNGQGQPVQTWTTTSAMEEGGSETHRFDNSGLSAVTVPAGTFDAWHLVHTRTDAQAVDHQLDEYFVPDRGFVRFECPEGEVWSLRPATP